MNRNGIVQAGLGLLIGLVLGIGGMTATNRTRPAPLVIQPPPPTSEPLPTDLPPPIQVFINGAVQRPGVYEVPFDSRLEDALVEAGGLTPDAFEVGVNLALPLNDGVQIYILSETEVEPVVVQGDNLAGVSTQAIGSTAALATGAGSAGDLETGTLVVNLNTATQADLEQLPGVGPSTAQSILDYREDNGSFGTIEEVMNVTGIGEGKFNQMAPFITVDG